MLNPWIVETIKDAARRELKDKDKNLITELSKWIDTVLQKWKLEKGDSNPLRGGSGLLFDPIPIPFDEAEPWECAGLVFPSRCSLAMKLLGESYPDFMSILEKVNFRVVLALLIEQEPAAGDDLFYAYDALVKDQSNWRGQLGATLRYWDKIQAGEVQKLNLALGNPIASKNKTIRAEQYHSDWKKWAKETWTAHRYWTVDQVAEHVLGLASEKGHKLANGNKYEIRTIKKVITGIKQELKTEN